MSAAREAAFALHRAGYSVVPGNTHSKRPAVDRWEMFQTERCSEDDIGGWYANGREAVGMVLGAVSGNAECLDFDERDAFHDARDVCLEDGIGELFDRICAGYLEATPSGGFHMVYRCDGPVEPNQKIARRPKLAHEMRDDKDRIKAMIETRGEGGFLRMAPSPGYVVLDGSVDDIVTITAEERAELLYALRTLDRMPEPRQWVPSDRPPSAIGTRPGDEFNESTTWAQILESEGWTFAYSRDGEDHWIRPGKERREGIGATTNYAGTDRLYVFSTSTEFEAERTYDKFGAWAVLHHGGDLRAAAKALRERGLGGGEPSPVPPRSPEPVAVGGGANLPVVRVTDGASFVLDEPEDTTPLWGEGEDSLWHPGESLLLNGPTGVGKTTLGQQLTLGRIGLRTEVLGMAVLQGKGRLLYIAADRPRQAARSLRRMVGPDDRDVLAERLRVWRGPLPFDIAKDTQALGELAAEFDADTVVIDSLKDVALKLSDDDVGAGVNQTTQNLVAAGIEVLTLHHQRKGQAGTRPKTIEDVYGSTWIVNGAGSVILLWGDPGDGLVDMLHLKQPVETVGPLKIHHDHTRGHSTVEKGADALLLLRGAHRGISARYVAQRMFEKSEPTRSDVEKARRRLERLVRGGQARSEGGHGGQGGRGDEALYFPMVGILQP